MRQSIDSLGSDLRANQTEVERLSQELVRLREDVLTDPLTALVNRRGFDVALDGLRAAVEQGNPSFSIVMIDIDHFKRVNDSHGHLVGDRVIQQVAGITKSCTRGGDTVVRYGGEEFAVLLPATSIQGARVVAENIRVAVQRAVMRPLRADSSIGPVTVSLGIGTFRAGEHVEHCTQRADLALYAAKQKGRNCIALEP
ncbi:MAG: GGDEF domain-containing protein [Burkholderiaceae bacterium]